jgi:hypothetical protein
LIVQLTVLTVTPGATWSSMLSSPVSGSAVSRASFMHPSNVENATASPAKLKRESDVMVCSVRQVSYSPEPTAHQAKTSAHGELSYSPLAEQGT